MKTNNRPENSREGKDDDLRERTRAREFPSMFETFKVLDPVEVRPLAMTTIRVSRGRRASRGIL
jgi:hypothetical protein